MGGEGREEAGEFLNLVLLGKVKPLLTSERRSSRVRLRLLVLREMLQMGRWYVNLNPLINGSRANKLLCLPVDHQRCAQLCIEDDRRRLMSL